MAMFYYEVTGNKCGRTITEEVKASGQREAREKFLRLNPDYRPGSAVRGDRA